MLHTTSKLLENFLLLMKFVGHINFIERIRTRTRTLRKSRHQTFRKSGAYTEIHCMSLKTIFDKFEGADSTYNISFLKFLALKYPNKAFLVLNLGPFFHFTEPT